MRKRVRGLPVCTFFYWCKVNLRKFHVHREIMNLIWIEGKNENLVLLTTRGRLFYFWGEYAVNCRKKYPADWFREKKILARKYLGEKISYTFMAYNPGKKSYTVTLYVGEKNLSPEVWRKTNSHRNQITIVPASLTPLTNYPIPPPRTKVKWKFKRMQTRSSHLNTQLMHLGN